MTRPGSGIRRPSPSPPSRPRTICRASASTTSSTSRRSSARRQSRSSASTRYGPLFTPFGVPGTPTGKEGTILSPGSIGGSNWPGAGLDPETGIMYIPSVKAPDTVELVKSVHKDSNLPLVRRNAFRPGVHPPGPQGLPSPFKPPYGRLTAIDLNRGEIVWAVPNGDGPRFHPALKALNLPPLGQGGRVGPAGDQDAGLPRRGWRLHACTSRPAAEARSSAPTTRVRAASCGRWSFRAATRRRR